MTEKEYIEREAALNAIKDEIDNYYRPNPNSYSITPYEFVRRGLNIAYSIIKNQPTADVQEVRHGEWKERQTHKNEVYCSECATIEKSTDTNYKSPICPNCGAKMDKE